MREVQVTSRTTPAKPRSGNYPIGTVIQKSGGTTVIQGGEGSQSIDIVKTGETTSFTDENVLSSKRAAEEFISRKNDSDVEAVVNFLNGLKINGVPFTELLTAGKDVEGIKDEAVMSAARILKEIIDRAISKTKEDQTEFLVKFLGGIEIGKFVSGLLGTGGAIQIDKDGNSHAEFDYLTIRKLAIFIELIIQEAKHVGGMLVVSPSGMTISKVEETDTAYRCYFEKTDGDRIINNQFTVGTQARRQTFNLTNQAYYWRLVTEVGDDYVDLSKADCETGSTIPQAGDELVGLGHRTDKTRQAAIIISAFGTNSPSIMYYQGIDSYSLEGCAVKMDYYDPVSGRFKSVTYGDTYVGAKDESTYIKYDQENGVEVKGRVSIQAGSNGWKNMDGLPEEIQAAADLAQQAQDDINNAAVGSVNILLNSGFTGNYETEVMDGDKQLDADTELYSKALLNWSGMATVQEDAGATSGRSATIGSLSQSVALIPNEVYVISYKAKGTSLVVSCGDYSVSQPVTAEYQRYTHKFTFTGAGVFLISGTATICDLQLERGTIATDWKPSLLDNDKTNAKFQAIQYLSDAMKNGSVDILGGLILANIIQLGNYKDGVLQKITAGISGIYNDDDDVYTWGGGSMEKAIYTVMKYKQDPQYVPTEEELLNMAKVVITHGGRAILNDVIVRGYIYALGGLFKGKVEIAGGKILLNEDGSGQLANGSVKWDAEGNVRVYGKYESSVGGDRIIIDPGNNSFPDFSWPSIQIKNKNDKEIISIIGFSGLGDNPSYTPEIIMKDPNNEYKSASYSIERMVVNEKIDGNNYQTYIGAGHIYIAKNSVIVWEQKQY